MLTLKNLRSSKDHLGNVVVPFEVPIGEAENFKGVVNIVDMKAREKRVKLSEKLTYQVVWKVK